MHPLDERAHILRRAFLATAASGLGTFALASGRGIGDTASQPWLPNRRC